MATSSDIDKSGAGTFTLRSSELGGQFTNDQYYNDLGFSGANISPQLSWKNEPEGTKSLLSLFTTLTLLHKVDSGTGSFLIFRMMCMS